MDERDAQIGASLADVRREGIVYALLDPRPEKYGRVRYVGMTTGTTTNRVKQHACSSKDGAKYPVHVWIRKLSLLGLHPISMVLESCPVDGVYEAEARRIATMRAIYPDLLNLCDRGPGTTGCKRSPETLLRMRQAQLGSKHSPEQIEKIRRSCTGQKRTPETRERLRLCKIGHVVTEETREKIRKHHLGHRYCTFSAGMRERLSQAKMGHPVSQETIEKIRRTKMERYGHG